MLHSLDDRIFVLQQVTAILRVDERYKFGQVCRGLRRFIHSKTMELKAMEEALRIGLTDVGPSGYSWEQIQPREKDMCKCIQNWHHMGATLTFRYFSEVDKASMQRSKGKLPFPQSLMTIQVAQMTTHPQKRILTESIDDLGNVGTPQEWEVAQVDEEEKTPNPVHEVFFLIRHLLSDPLWYDRFRTPFNEWTPPLLYLWASFPEGKERPSHITAELPQPPNHFVDKRVLTLPYKSIRVEDPSEGEKIFLSRHVVLMASRLWLFRAFSQLQCIDVEDEKGISTSRRESRQALWELIKSYCSGMYIYADQYEPALVKQLADDLDSSLPKVMAFLKSDEWLATADEMMRQFGLEQVGSEGSESSA